MDSNNNTNDFRIGFFWGSDTGTTEIIINELVVYLSDNFKIELHEMHEVTIHDFSRYDYFILALPTWYDGQLQSDWDEFFESFCTIDFNDKYVAILGLGDQYGYAEYFVDGIGVVGQQVLDAGGKLLGEWPTDSYDFEQSKAELKKGTFCGLAID